MEKDGRVGVSVVIPAHDEEGNIVPLAEKLDRAFRALGVSAEAVIVDDGSTDGTAAELANCADRFPFLRVVTHPRRRGLTAALNSAFAASRGEVLVFLPADLESDPEEDVPKLLARLREGYDLVCGWRQGQRDSKRFASAVYNFVSRRLFPVEAHDLNWIKAFTREVAGDLPLRSDWHRFIAMIAAAKGYRVGEVKTGYHPRTRGRSKFGLGRILISFFDLLAVRFLFSFGGKPMLFFGTAGLACLALSAGLGVHLGLLLWNQPDQRPLFRFVLLALFFLTGLLLWGIGFLAELVIHPREKDRAR